MENYSYSSYPESGDSSPRSREIECENPTPWEEAPPPAARVKLMCSYGGRIQPRQHDNQLSYVGGETKILAVDRAIRFPAVLQRLSSLLPATADICFKYQLPGEDLDALISVTNDEDLEHMMLEYDRLVRSNAKPTPRLRLFLFPLASPPAAQPADQKQWFLEALNAPPPPQAAAAAAAAVSSPDFLFGFDQGFVPPPAVRTKDPAPEPAAAGDTLTVDVTARSDPGSKEVISPVEMQRQIQELQRLQIAENQQQQQQQQQPPAATPTFQRNGSDDASAARAQPTEYYLPRAQEKAVAAPPPPPAAYWPDQRVAAGARFASMAGGDQPVYLIPAGYAPQAYYAMPRMLPAEPYRDAPAMYAAAPPQQQAGGGGAGRAPPQQGAEGTGYTVAYDSAGRAVYYTSAVPTYQAVTSVGPISPAVDGSMAVKPPQAS